MNGDDKARAMEALGIAESIAMQIRGMISGSVRPWNASEFSSISKTLSEIEDSLYRKGEYAVENAASIK